jgi:hydroxymethylbilane synthase
MNNKIIKIGTRGSVLALWQANYIKNLINKKYPDTAVELIKIKTTGDKIIDRPLADIGGKGLFIKEIEAALQQKEIDLAVHSLKDVPAILPEGCEIYATPERESPYDAFVSNKYKNINELKISSIIGTGSARRKVQLLKFNRNISIKDLRGNVTTRLKKLKEGNFDCIILAHAGLTRLGLTKVVAQILDDNIMIPAVCQGIIGVEVRRDDENTKKYIEHINDRQTQIVATSERAFLKTMGGSCKVPMGGFCQIKHNKIFIKGFVSSIDGSNFIYDEVTEESFGKANIAGIRLAEKLLQRGGNLMIEELNLR